MAISDTIQSMYENVGNVYDVLELAGADLTNVDKNIFNLKQSWEERLLYFLANGTDVVWNNWLPKVNGTGESITLNNTIQAKMDFVYKGNTSQESTTGKNKLPYTNDINETINSTKITGVKGTYTIQTTPTATVYQTYVNLVENYTIQSGDYLHIMNDVANANITFNLKCTDDTILSPTLNSLNRIFDLSSYVGKTISSIRFYVSTSYDGAKITLTPMIINSGTASDYEPYTGGNPAPNPDYPYPVNVVTGDNEVKVEGKNLYDISSSLDNKFYESNGTLTNQNNSFGEKIQLDIDTISLSIKNNYSGTLRSYIFLFDKDMNRIGAPRWGDTLASGETYTLQNYKREGAKYITISILDVPSALKNQVEIMLNRGTTVSNYVPHQSQTYPINLGSMELCKIGDYQDYIRKSTGKNLVNVVSTNEITYTGYGNFTLNNGVITTSGLTLTGFKVKVEPNTQYTAQLFATFTSGTNALRIREFNSEPTDWNTGYIVQNAVSIKNNDISNLTVTTSATTQWLLFVIYSDASGLVCKKIQLEKGSTATNWEPFGTGWYKYGAIGKAVYDGDENWTYENSESTPTERTVFRVETFTAGTNPNYISNRFIYNSQSPNRFVLIPNNNRPYMSIDNNLVNISTSDSSETKVSKLKTFVSSNNIVIYYVLNTPTITEITDTALINQLEAIKLSYNEQTNISQTNADKPFILDVTALKDLDTEDTTPALTTNRGLPFTQPPVSENFINDEDDNNILEETTNEEEPNIEDDNKEEEEPLDFFEKEIINNDEEQGEIPTEPIEIDNGQR